MPINISTCYSVGHKSILCVSSSCKNGTLSRMVQVNSLTLCPEKSLLITLLPNLILKTQTPAVSLMPSFSLADAQKWHGLKIAFGSYIWCWGARLEYVENMVNWDEIRAPYEINVNKQVTESFSHRQNSI